MGSSIHKGGNNEADWNKSSKQRKKVSRAFTLTGQGLSLEPCWLQVQFLCSALFPTPLHFVQKTEENRAQVISRDRSNLKRRAVPRQVRLETPVFFVLSPKRNNADLPEISTGQNNTGNPSGSTPTAFWNFALTDLTSSHYEEKNGTFVFLKFYYFFFLLKTSYSVPKK